MATPRQPLFVWLLLAVTVSVWVPVRAQDAGRAAAPVGAPAAGQAGEQPGGQGPALDTGPRSHRHGTGAGMPPQIGRASCRERVLRLV